MPSKNRPNGRGAQAKKRRPSKATRFTHKKFRWLDQLSLDSELPPLALRVCVQLLPSFNLKYGGAAWLYQDTLATRLGLRRETISRVLNAVVARGHLESVKQARDKPNIYRMVLKDEAAPIGAPDAADRSSRCDQPRTSSKPMMCADDVSDGALCCEQPLTEIPFKIPGVQEDPQEEGERDAPSARDFPVVAAALEGPRAEDFEESKQGAVAAEIIAPGSFEELRTLWLTAREGTDDPTVDRRAFESACQRAAPAEIIEGARVWVEAATETGNERYVPSLAKWLSADAWTEPPPKRWQQRQATHGRSLRHNGHHHNGGRVDLAKLALEYGYGRDE
jgi:hypothetical protein